MVGKNLFLFLLFLSFRMSLGHLLPLIWRTTVDQWEVELFLDMAHRGQTSKEEGTRRTRKRAAGSDEEDGETSQAAKKRKKGNSLKQTLSVCNLNVRCYPRFKVD